MGTGSCVYAIDMMSTAKALQNSGADCRRTRRGSLAAARGQKQLVGVQIGVAGREVEAASNRPADGGTRNGGGVGGAVWSRRWRWGSPRALSLRPAAWPSRYRWTGVSSYLIDGGYIGESHLGIYIYIYQ